MTVYLRWPAFTDLPPFPTLLMVASSMLSSESPAWRELSPEVRSACLMEMPTLESKLTSFLQNCETGDPMFLPGCYDKTCSWPSGSCT